MHLRIKPFNALIKDMYNGHGHFHEGDAGIDLFIIEEQIIEPGVTARIHLGIACENIDNKPYLLMPRSSISKTPLRQCNSIGLIDAGYRGEIMAAVDNIKTGVISSKARSKIIPACGYGWKCGFF
ncbi:hypothetical protein Ct9H90mP29_17290 [bacterium]|nr:MAG: hypothetical protein Ct9H90mP29_17290 [bacterium]